MRVPFLCVFLLAACSSGGASVKPPESPCRQQSFEGSRFTVCEAGDTRLKLVAAGPKEASVRSFADLPPSVPQEQVAFAMNAGMFDEAGRPIGLAIADGQSKHAINLRDGGGNFHLQPNGVFLVTTSGRAMVVRSQAYSDLQTEPQQATQSGPMLVIQGKLHPKFDHDGESRNIRNGVGVTADGKAVFVISEDLVSFGRLGRFFRDALKTPNALYFDGSVSSLWDPANGRQDSHVELGPMIVAVKAAE
ncbi:MAG: phosphodiester glycosidase family protein [Pseudomonadota bacterium]|nr:phosphodiester glycosidase family protein [Pseudomonadota bacterium]